MQVYLVGGAVRDKLLGLDSQDQDYVVVGADSRYMLDLGFIPVGADFPVFLHPKTHAEFALARTERKQGRGYLGFEIDSRPTVTLAEDLLRRDLTINAMAIQLHGFDDLTPIDGTIIDPYGGQQDLQLGRLRHVSKAFSEDPLRVLRVARFYGRYQKLGFKVDERTLALMRFMVSSGELDSLTRERVWQETSRAMMQDNPAAYWQLLHQVNAIAVIFPAIAEMIYPLTSIASNAQSEADCTCTWFADDGLMATALQLSVNRELNLSQRWALLTAAIASNAKHGWQRQFFINDLNDWQRVIKKLGKTLLIPKKISKFALLTAENAMAVHDLLSQSVVTKDTTKQAQTIIEFINSTKANKDNDSWQQLVEVVSLMSQAQLTMQMQVSIKAFAQVGMDDIDLSLNGPEIGNALNQARQKRILETLHSD